MKQSKNWKTRRRSTRAKRRSTNPSHSPTTILSISECSTMCVASSSKAFSRRTQSLLPVIYKRNRANVLKLKLKQKQKPKRKRRLKPIPIPMPILIPNRRPNQKPKPMQTPVMATAMEMQMPMQILLFLLLRLFLLWIEASQCRRAPLRPIRSNRSQKQKQPCLLSHLRRSD